MNKQVSNHPDMNNIVGSLDGISDSCQHGQPPRERESHHKNAHSCRSQHRDANQLIPLPTDATDGKLFSLPAILYASQLC